MNDWNRDEAAKQELRAVQTELADCREQARRSAHDLGERVKELSCLYAVASLLQLPARPLPEVMQGIANQVVLAYQYPDITGVRITFDGQACCSEGFRQTAWRQAAEPTEVNGSAGLVEVFYREERPAADEGPFLKQERSLLNTVAQLITQHLRIRHEQDALQQREREFRTLAENSTDVVARFDRELRRIYGNPAIEALLGRSRQFILGKTNRELGMPEDVANLWDRNLEQVFSTGRVQTLELTVPTPKGDRVFESRLIPEFGSGESVETLLAISRDITEHKRMEQVLRASEARYRRQAAELEAIYRRAPVGLAVLDTQLHFLRVNERLAEMNGLPAEMHIGKTAREIVPAIADPAESIVRQIVETGEPALNIEFRGETRAQPGVERFWNEQWLPLKDSEGKVWGINVVVEEITERKRVEEALRESEKKYRMLVETLYEGIWLIDQDDNTTFVNNRMAELLGYEPEEMLGKNFLLFMDARAAQGAKRYLARGRSGVRGEHELLFRRKNGDPIWSHVATAPLYDEQGNYQGLLAGVVDITARKQAEEALARRQQEFEALVERSPDIIARIDLARRMTYINPAVERVTGHPREWFLGKNLVDWGLTPSEKALRERLLREVFEGGREQTAEHEYPSQGGVQYFHSRLVPEFGPDGRMESVLVVDRDITDLKLAQFALERLTLEDPVTGIANRRYLEQFITREWGREVRHKHSAAVIMADIDHFKIYNDRYGHQRGDDCLRQVAHALKEHLHRPTDFLVRYGGEEFVAVLLETDLDGAMRLAEAMRRAVADQGLRHESSPVASIVTISLGVAAAHAHKTTFSELLSAADHALYQAKHNGRNRVEVGHSPQPST